MKLNNLVIIRSCSYNSCQLCPLKERIRVVRTLSGHVRGSLAEMEYAPAALRNLRALVFAYCDEVRLMLYDAGEGGHAYETVAMSPAEDGTWTLRWARFKRQVLYFQCKNQRKMAGRITPGINAQAVECKR